MKDQLNNAIKDIVKELLVKNGFNGDEAQFSVVIPEEENHGDFACNAAMQLARFLKKPPRTIAEEIAGALVAKTGGDISAEIAGPGFINITVSKKRFMETVTEILENPRFFHNNLGAGQKVIVEFVSANPTGPLHIGHGRGAAYGDSLARVLSVSGYEVSREYYVNDAGNQMNNLALSVYHRAMEMAGKSADADFPENCYKGDYIKEIAGKLLKEQPDIFDKDKSSALEICLERAVDEIKDGIDKDLRRFGVEFDNWFSEKSLYKSGAVEETLERLKSSGKIFEKDGALWLNTSSMGDDKDRVLKKSTGEYTYLTPDIAYHDNKYKRAFKKVIDVWGADHHGYVKRMRCALKALGYDEASFDAVLIQMVNLIQNGEKISMSTRSGEFIPLSWLIDEVGVDAARFFYNMRSCDAQFDFDMDLAKSESNDNPVHYIQYAHARVCSLLANAAARGFEYKRGFGLEKAIGAEEIRLIKNMIRLKYVMELAAQHYEPHRIAHYLQELAAMFHSYYYANKIITDDEEITNGKLSVCEALGKTIAQGLNILGVDAPERM